MRDGSEASWLVPAIVLTLASGVFALAMLPDHSNVVPALGLLILWCVVAALIWAVCGRHGILSMLLARVENPIGHLTRTLRAAWPKALLITFAMVLAGLNMVTFMWTKPLLNVLVSFWADPLLADIDHALFLGHDPWRFLSWLNSMPMAIFYHRGWFALMIITLLFVLSRPPSREKSAILLCYFLLWSVFGPVVHALLPAGGPIFYEQLGYGDRFAAIPLPEDMVKISDYLWMTYATGGFGAGSGISAMPSLHIATTAWMVLAIQLHAPRWTKAIAAVGLLIFLLSISLGWHYAVDGIVGSAGAVGLYWLCHRLLDRRPLLWRAKPASTVEAEA